MTLPLSDDNYVVLKYLIDNGGTAECSSFDSDRLRMLDDYRYLDRSVMTDFKTCSITVKGRDYVRLFEEEAKKLDDEKKQLAEQDAKEKMKEIRDREWRREDRRRDWQFLLLGAIIGYVLGWLNPLSIISPADLWNFITDFFSRLTH